MTLESQSNMYLVISAFSNERMICQLAYQIICLPTYKQVNFCALYSPHMCVNGNTVYCFNQGNKVCQTAFTIRNESKKTESCTQITL